MYMDRDIACEIARVLGLERVEILRPLSEDYLIALKSYMDAVEMGREPSNDVVRRIDELVKRFRFWIYDPRGGAPIPVCRDANDPSECCEKLGGVRMYAYDNVVECAVGGKPIVIIDLGA